AAASSCHQWPAAHRTRPRSADQQLLPPKRRFLSPFRTLVDTFCTVAGASECHWRRANSCPIGVCHTGEAARYAISQTTAPEGTTCSEQRFESAPCMLHDVKRRVRLAVSTFDPSFLLPIDGPPPAPTEPPLLAECPLLKNRLARKSLFE